MPALTTFTDFLNATDEHVVTPTSRILNDAVQNKYLLRDMLRGQDDKQIVKGGSKLVDYIQLEDPGTFSHFHPNDVFSPVDHDITLKIEAPWRFSVDYFTYNEQTMSLNQGDPTDQYKEFKKIKEQGARTSMVNGMEETLIDVPVASTMEDAGGRVPYTFMAFIDELGTGLWPGWTTVQTVSPATETRWRNKIRSYNPLDILDPVDGILAQFDRMFEDVDYEAPESTSAYFESDDMRKQKILTNLDGLATYKSILRLGNDSYVSPQDPAYNTPVYSGIPVKHISRFNDANLDQDALVNSSVSQPWQDGEPRYIWLNCKYLKPIFHTNGYMRREKPINGGVQQPWTWVVYFETRWNLFCHSRQRQGIVTPAGFAG